LSDRYHAQANSPEEQQAIQRLGSALTPWRNTLRAMELQTAQNPETSGQIVSAIYKQSWVAETTDVDEALSQLNALNTRASLNIQSGITSVFQKVFIFFIIAMLVAIILSISLGLVLSRLIAHPLTHMVGVIRRVAHGNLADIDDLVKLHPGRDEIAVMARELNAMLSNLRTLVGQVLNMSKQASKASSEVAVSSVQAGEAVGNIADATEQVALGAQNAAEALVTASNSIVRLQEQSEVVQTRSQETYQALGELQESIISTTASITQLGARSTEIANISTTIAEIADETNMLALNAAIEAARAGEAGRGFAVVAEEVRKLAKQAASATVNIHAIISHIQKDTGSVITMMQESTSRMELGMTRVGQTKDAATHMDSNVKKINDALSFVAGISQDNGAAAEEVSAETIEVTTLSQSASLTAQSLNRMSQDLCEAAHVFYWDGRAIEQEILSENSEEIHLPLSSAA
jgi:methyl-accepting chemotaxis protein